MKPMKFLLVIVLVVFASMLVGSVLGGLLGYAVAAAIQELVANPPDLSQITPLHVATIIGAVAGIALGLILGILAVIAFGLFKLTSRKDPEKNEQGG